MCGQNGMYATSATLAAGKQDSAKPPKSSLALGDARINPFITSYRTEYAAPFASGARIRSPLRNKMLADVADLKEIYSSAFQRVGEYAALLLSGPDNRSFSGNSMLFVCYNKSVFRVTSLYSSLLHVQCVDWHIFSH